MHKVEITKPAKVPAEAIWQVLSDFGGFMNWARFSQGEIEVEGEGVGMIRHLKSAVGDIGEQLTSLDNETRQIGYRIVYGEPIGMKAYQALVTVIAKGHDSCEINWSGMFEPIDPDTRDQVAEALAGSYQAMHKALESYTLARL